MLSSAERRPSRQEAVESSGLQNAGIKKAYGLIVMVLRMELYRGTIFFNNFRLRALTMRFSKGLFCTIIHRLKRRLSTVDHTRCAYVE